MNTGLNNTSIKNIKEISKFLICEAFKSGQVPPNICITGAPGVGKSSIVEQNRKEIQEELQKIKGDEVEVKIIDVRLAAMEASDVNGIPFNHEGEMRFSTPEWFPAEDKNTFYILFLDEITNASLPVQHAAYRLVLDRSIQNGSRLPDSCAIIAAGNRQSDNTGAKSLSAAFANRFALHFEVDMDDEESQNGFLEYAASAGFDPRVIGYLSWKRTNISTTYNKSEAAFATPRSWEYVSNHFKSGILDKSENQGVILSGTIGNAVAVDFMGFLHYSDQLPDWNQVKSGAIEYTVKDGDEGVKYAIATSIAYEVAMSVKANKIDEVNNLMKVVNQLPAEMAPVVNRLVRATGKEVLAALTKSKEYVSWIAKVGRFLVS